MQTIRPWTIPQKRIGISWTVSHPDSKVHGANMGPIWDRQNLVGPHVGPMNFAIWDTIIGGQMGHNL